jgi:hypothetical protein
MHSMLGIATTSAVLAASSSVGAPNSGHLGGAPNSGNCCGVDGEGSTSVVRAIQIGEGMDAQAEADDNAGVLPVVCADAHAVTVGSTRPLITSYDCKKRYAALLPLNSTIMCNNVGPLIIRSENELVISCIIQFQLDSLGLF